MTWHHTPGAAHTPQAGVPHPHIGTPRAGYVARRMPNRAGASETATHGKQYANSSGPSGGSSTPPTAPASPKASSPKAAKARSAAPKVKTSKASYIKPEGKPRTYKTKTGGAHHGHRSKKKA